MRRLRNFLGLLVVLAGVQTVLAQQWHATNSIPVYRATEAQVKARSAILASGRCLSQIWQLAQAMRLYSYDHQDQSPTNWAQCQDYISTPGTLLCPLSPNSITDTNWAHLDFAQASYTLFPADFTSPRSVTITCRLHGNYALADGSCYQAKEYSSFDLPPGTGLGVPNYAYERTRRVQRVIECVNNLKQIGSACRMFSEENAEPFATSFSEIEPYLGGNPGTLFCPAAETVNIPIGFDNFDFSRANYTIAVLPNDASPETPYITCPLHGNYCAVDGSVTIGPAAYDYPGVITGNPISQTVEPGTTATFQIPTAQSLPPPRFQWRRQQPFDSDGNPWTNTVVLTGATNSTLVISNCTAQDEGYYDVVVSVPSGYSEASLMVYLRVEPLTNITSNGDWEVLCCCNNLRQILLAAMLHDRFSGQTNADETFPSAPAYYATFLGWPMALFCPSDSTRTPPSAWDLANLDLSYVINDGVPTDWGPNIVASCKVHHFYIQADGTVVTVGSPLRLAAQADRAKLALSWSGGNPPFQIQMTTNLSSGTWNDFAGPVNSNNFVVPLTNFAAFYKVVGTTPGH